jgi:hypothetical protein
MGSANDADLTIPARYNGPAKSGNGGYAAGVLADRVPDEGNDLVEVTLRRPPPLDVAMQVLHLSTDDGAATTRLSLAGDTVAEARPVHRELAPVEAVSAAQATEAMANFAGRKSHPFPTCFGCGPERAEGDGLRIFPGPVSIGKVAALWKPHPALAESSDLLDQGVQRVGVGVGWAALDCVGGWAGDIGGRKMVLGRMTAGIDALPVVGEPHVVVAQQLGTEGRKTFTASTLYDSDGRIVARAEHVWISVDPADFN